VQNDVFFKVPYVSWIWGFVDMYLAHLETRIWSLTIHTYSIKWFFWPPKLYCTPRAQEIFIFFSILNLLILQMVWDKCVGFGGHINIQVNYKILQLEASKKAQILHNLPCFQEGLFWGNFGLNTAIAVEGLNSNVNEWFFNVFECHHTIFHCIGSVFQCTLLYW
jgi:hypothetical protein